MRPRPDAAEKRPAAAYLRLRCCRASMRPRPDAAEKRRGRPRTAVYRFASMRPRPDAAEKRAGYAPQVRDTQGFNEAAARCRGKTRGHAGGARRPRPASMRPRPDAAEKLAWPRLPESLRPLASMRPRPDAAEKPRCGTARGACSVRFNEAAARCRGKTFGRPPPLGSGRGFNEAAARCRGKTRRCRVAGRVAGVPSFRFNEAAARCRGKTMASSAGSIGSLRFNEAAARCRGKTTLARSRSTATGWLQ